MAETPAAAVPAASTGADGLSADFWARYFRVYDTLNEAPPYRRMLERYVELLRPASGERILDAGSGTGNVTRTLLREGAEMTGMDFCEPALEICRGRMPGTSFVFGDLTRRIPFDDASFDKLSCCNVIYTLPPEHQPNAARELLRVLRPGGVAAFTVFGAGFQAFKIYLATLRAFLEEEGIFTMIRKGLRYSISTARIFWYVGKIKRQQRSGSYTFYTPEQARALFADAGWEIIAIERTFGDQCLMIHARRPEGPVGVE